jgi:hypothetical protein
MSIIIPENDFVARLVALANRSLPSRCERVVSAPALDAAKANPRDCQEMPVVSEPVHLSHTTSVTFERVNVEPWRPALSPTEVFDIKSIVFPDVVKFQPESGKGFNVPGWNDEVMRQLGRALAHARHTTWHIDTQWDGEDLPPSVYCLARDGETRQLRVSVYNHISKNGAKHPVALTEVWNAEKLAWVTHPITHRSRKAAIRTSKYGWVTAYTKYHFIAVLLQNWTLNLDKPIIVRTKAPDMARRMIFDGYRRELWKLAGYDYRQFRTAKELLS